MAVKLIARSRKRGIGRVFHSTFSAYLFRFQNPGSTPDGTDHIADGSQRQYPGPVTVADVAQSIGTGPKAALGGRVAFDGAESKLVDTSYRIESDASLAIVTAKDADGLDLIRHSTAHLLAYAVKSLFPDAQVTIGPVIDNGFYYDFSYKRPFTPEDLAAIEKMAELAKKDEVVTRGMVARRRRRILQGHRRKQGRDHRLDPVQRDAEPVPRGQFIDLCRGPHVPSTGKLKVFKLMKVAGAWRGDSEMLQRIYGTAWATKDEQDAYLHMLEEAERRDHRKIGRELDLFHFQDEAPGLIFWHPRAGRCGSRSSSTCAASIATTATRK